MSGFLLYSTDPSNRIPVREIRPSGLKSGTLLLSENESIAVHL